MAEERVTEQSGVDPLRGNSSTPPSTDGPFGPVELAQTPPQTGTPPAGGTPGIPGQGLPGGPLGPLGGPGGAPGALGGPGGLPGGPGGLPGRLCRHGRRARRVPVPAAKLVHRGGAAAGGRSAKALSGIVYRTRLYKLFTHASPPATLYTRSTLADCLACRNFY